MSTSSTVRKTVTIAPTQTERSLRCVAVPSFIAIAPLMFVVACGSSAPTPSARPSNVAQDNKALVTRAVDELFGQKDLSAVDRYWAEPYLQHDASLASGVEAFREFVRQVVPTPGFKFERTRVVGEGDLVAVHSQDGKLVEHWDGKESEAKPSPSGHTMLEGPTEVQDEDRTEANRQVVVDFLNAGPVRGETVEIDTLARFFNGDAYIQHNPRIADGLTGLGAFISGLRAQGVSFSYTQVHRVLAEGNFVLAQSEGQIAGTKNAFYDLFRVENGKLAEHWDTIEEVPATTKSGLPVF